MEMIKKMRREMKKIKKKHEEECKELQVLCEENTLIKQHMHNKGCIQSTPTQVGSAKQTRT